MGLLGCLPCHYTVYRNGTDKLVILDGTYRQCAKAMGIRPENFHKTLWAVRRGKNRKWSIYMTEAETE